mmetsp:Transcript_104904/g.295499  ORF Transcript_104904/g.295499 Transcript_104904/m.295499 type:complete len:239 (-) Transcript_104904:145-861(-)
MAATRGYVVASLALTAASLVFFGRSLGISFVGPARAHGHPQITESISLRGRRTLNSAANFELPATAHSWGSHAIASVAALAVAVGVLMGASSPAQADAEVIGEIQASGLIFKDTINVQAITDPKVSGVTLYQSDFAKSSFDKLKSGDLFSDPGASGLSCVAEGKVLVSPSVSKDKGGEEVYSEAKAFLGKTLKVKRVYDEKHKNVIYVVYTERFNKDDDKNGSRFKSQVCAIHADGFQ